MPDLPDFIRIALEQNLYSRGEARYSVSDLINPPQMRILKEKHWDEVAAEHDIMDDVESFIGTAVHEKVERAGGGPNDILERRLFSEIAGELISGAIDCYNEKLFHIFDIKVTKVAKVMWGSFSSWEAQLNCYAYLSRVMGHRVDWLTIVAFLKDWDYKRAELEPTYPQEKIQVIPIPTWNPQRAATYIHERVALQKAADQDPEAYPCKSKDRWKGNLRCHKFCEVNKFCKQYKEMVA